MAAENLVGTGYDGEQRNLGMLIVGVRIDDLPTGESERLVAAGQFHPLTFDANGNLRVVAPPAQAETSDEVRLLKDIRDLLIENRNLQIETRDLLLKIA